jgi:hypothetical protein
MKSLMKYKENVNMMYVCFHTHTLTVILDVVRCEVCSYILMYSHVEKAEEECVSHYILRFLFPLLPLCPLAHVVLGLWCF